MNGADRFTRRAQIPMLILSVAFIAVLVTPVINDHLSPAGAGHSPWPTSSCGSPSLPST